MIFRCKICSQPISREMALPAKAGGFTKGRCQKCTWALEPQPPSQDSFNAQKGGQNDQAHTNAAS